MPWNIAFICRIRAYEQFRKLNGILFQVGADLIALVVPVTETKEQEKEIHLFIRVVNALGRNVAACGVYFVYRCIPFHACFVCHIEMKTFFNERTKENVQT